MPGLLISEVEPEFQIKTGESAGEMSLSLHEEEVGSEIRFELCVNVIGNKSVVHYI